MVFKMFAAKRRGAMRASALGVVVALGLAACSGSDSNSAETTSASTPSTEAGTTVAETTAPETTAPETTVPETTEPECPAAVPNEVSQPAGIVAAFDPTAFELSEGLAVDKSGNVYVSLAPLGKVVRFAPGSSEYEVFAEVPDWDLGPEDYFVDHFGILGLALDADGHVYAAVDTAGRAGVWRFDCRTGEGTRFEGTEDMLFANALAFDDQGNLFATESFSGMDGDMPLGAIWKITPDGVAEKWLENTTLGSPSGSGTAKPPGANGIAFRDGLLYVANTLRTSILTVPVSVDGSPGEIAPYAVSDFGFIGDGLALDAEGRVYINDQLSNGIVRVNPDATVDPIAGGVEAGFDNASSLAWGVGSTSQTVYIVNLAGGSLEQTDLGPALIAVDVDTPGMPLPYMNLAEPEGQPEDETESDDAGAADPLDLAPGESIVFEVDVIVTESSSDGFEVGAVLWMPNCYTLTAEGVFIDPVFPSPDAPASGTWTSAWDGTTATYQAAAGEGLVLEQTGVVTVDAATGTLSLTADSSVSIEGDPVVRLTSTGQAADACTPVPG
jgi:sugar lactone lactonase YvrE